MANKLKIFADVIGTASATGTATLPPQDVDAHPHPQPARLTVWGTLVHELGAEESEQFLQQAKQLQADSRLHKTESLNGGVSVAQVRISRPVPSWLLVLPLHAFVCSFDAEFILARNP
jgi:hypothetical protein